MSETEKILEKCTECGLCTENCEFLSKYSSDTPRELAMKFAAGYSREKPLIPYSCNMCGLCQEICPEELNIGKMCLDLREELVKDRLAPLPSHHHIQISQDFNTSDSFALARQDPANKKCERVFFPGCTLSGYSPSLVLKVYDYLCQKLFGIGIVLGCCGEPTRSIGEKSRFHEILKGTVDMFKGLGTSEVITACPLCYKTFKEYAPELKVTFLSEVLLQVGLPEGMQGNKQTFSLFDSCSARWEKAIQDSVRALVNETGHSINEMEHTQETTRCCGLGGMVSFTDPDLAFRMTQRTVNEANHDILTYCAACREAFIAYKPVIHILDLLFNPDWEKSKLQPPSTGEMRRENRAKLATMIRARSPKKCTTRKKK